MLKRVLFWCAVAAGVLVALFVFFNLIMVAGEQHNMYDSANDTPKRTVVIIPGASVFSSGALSGVFLDRVNAAIALYKAGRVSKVLVSGDNGSTDYNEVNPVRTYLLEEGIPDTDIYLDHAGFDTYSTMYRAKYIFGVDSAVIATQSFHLPRALFIARSIGVDAVGLRSDTVHLQWDNYVRESLARVKAVLDLVEHRTPMYLGEKIPIT